MELARTMQLLSKGLPTCITKCTVKGAGWEGLYYFVGSIPVELTILKPTMFNPEHRESFSYATEQEAINALLAIGKTTFQLDDCSWYGK